MERLNRWLTTWPDILTRLSASCSHLQHYTTQCTLYNAHFTLYNVHCTLYSPQYTLHTVSCSVECSTLHYSAVLNFSPPAGKMQGFFSWYSGQCSAGAIITHFTVQCVLYTVQCNYPYTVRCRSYSVYCIHIRIQLGIYGHI